MANLILNSLEVRNFRQTAYIKSVHKKSLRMPLSNSDLVHGCMKKM
jgi:hypothetical protein